jgi:UDP-N-acetyl-D-glucosamine dehydrogenase
MSWRGEARGKVVVGVVGMGYVGLPLLLQFCRSGNTAIGFDIDEEKVKSLSAGKSYIRHIESSALAEAIQTGRLSATTDFSRIAEVDAVIICVPTPLTRHREPDISYIVNTGKQIGPHLRSGQVVVLESTTYPGTTDEDLKPILEKLSGLKAGVDFHLAFSPER